MSINELGLVVCAGAIGMSSGCYSGREGSGLTAGQDDPAADGGDDGGDSADDGGDDGAAADCSQPSVGATPLRRLTRFEYDNTVRDLLDDASRPALEFTPDEKLGGYASNSVAPVSQTQLDQYGDAAETLAQTFVDERLASVVACDVAQTACATDFIETFGRRAFRRPLSAEEVADYVALYESGKGQWDGTTGVRLTVQAMLMSPSFLYHVEELPAGADEADVTELGEFELASRLSYFVWASMPDDALLDAAESGDLATAEGVEAQVRRMLADDRAADTIASFHEQWMHLDSITDLVKDYEMFPQWSEALALAMQEETRSFADEVIRHGDGKLQTLMTAPWTIADASLAQLYGVAPAAGESGFGKIDLPASERAGLLTQAGFLATNAHAAEVSWVYRGKFVRENLLCQPLPAPPPGVEVNDALDLGRLDNPECASCHLMMDPIGMGFDDYDPIGIYADNGASGEVTGVDDIGQFDSAVELAGSLAASPDVHDCVATQWFRYAARRENREADDCSLQSIQATFAASGQDVRELIVAVATADTFRNRTSAEAE